MSGGLVISRLLIWYSCAELSGVSLVGYEVVGLRQEKCGNGMSSAGYTKTAVACLQRVRQEISKKGSGGKEIEFGANEIDLDS